MKRLWEDMVNKGSSLADVVIFRPHIYARTQQSLPPLWAAIKQVKPFHDTLAFESINI